MFDVELELSFLNLFASWVFYIDSNQHPKLSDLKYNI